MGIDLIPFSITIDGKEFFESYSFTPAEYYPLLEQAHALPTTSQIAPAVFQEKFEQAYQTGYDCVICTTMTSVGSGTYRNAVTARNWFYNQHPWAGDRFTSM